MAATGFDPGTPGFTAARISAESAVLFQSFFLGDVVYDGLQIIDSTAIDAGNSPTSILRPGLVMAKLDSNGAWVDYDPTATDGSQEARGISVQEINLIDYTTGSSATRMWGSIVLAGKAKASALIGLDQQARNQLARRGMMFDDDVWFPVSLIRRRVTKAANYTLVAADHGTQFQAITGAVTFTLPPIASNLGFCVEFLNAVDANMAITSPEGTNIVSAGSLGVTTLTFSTASNKIGAHIRLEAMYVNATLKWVFSILNASTNIVTAT